MPSPKKSTAGNPDVVYHKNRQEPPAKAKSASKGIGLNGLPCEINDPTCLAKETFDAETGHARYYVKVATSGDNAGHMYNPQSPTAAPHELKRVDMALGRGRYEFKKTTLDSFNLYVKFLSGGNIADYRHADRMRI